MKENVIIQRVGRNIREQRIARKITQAGLARMLSCHRQQVWDWENGAHEPGISAVIRLADALGVSLDSLAGRNGIT